MIFMILAILPVLCWLLIALTLNKKGLCWRSCFLSASVVWGLTLTAFTEVLSIFKLLTFSWLLFFWAVAAFIALLIYFYVTPNNTVRTAVKIPLFLKLLVGGIAAIAIITCVIASIAPPNNWDSMTYHMSRVVHWMQNRSVEHYPTHILRQLYLNPWAEFAIMHLQILIGRDYLANLVQWFSMIGSIIGIGLIAKQCGADLRGQVYASVIVATIPMGIMQASSTQNDYVVAFWLVCFVYFGIRLKEKLNFYDVLAVGVSLGLAILTKSTAYIYAFPFLLWFFFSGARSFRWKMVTQILILSLLVLSLNIGHYKRNYELFGNPLTAGEFNFSNEMFSISAFISNISRNLALHISTPYDTINNASMSMVISLHRLLGVDLNEPKTTWPETKLEIKGIYTGEDDTGNPLHLTLIILSVALVLCYKDLRRMPNLLIFLCALSVSFLLFCFYLRWQPWNSRLHLPLFVLWSAVIGVVLSKLKYKWFAHAIMIILLLASIHWVLHNPSRPLIEYDGRISIWKSSRFDQYFNNRPSLGASYYSTAGLTNIQKCKDIGLRLEWDDWEYPIWVLIQRMGTQMPRIEHVQVTNKSSKIFLINFEPCVLIQSDKDSKSAISFIQLGSKVP
jgi:hypothetical protein